MKKLTVTGVFWVAYQFLYSLIMAFIGVVTFVFCLFVMFRHGSWIAEISVLEFFWFSWLFFCFYTLVKQEKKYGYAFFIYVWKLFKLIGNILIFPIFAFIFLHFCFPRFNHQVQLIKLGLEGKLR